MPVKYLRKALLGLALALLLCVGAGAYTFSSVDGVCDVDTSGTCRFTVSGVIDFAEPVTEFSIPLGEHVSGASAEIYATSVRKENGVSALVFTREAGFSGQMNVTWSYTIQNTVTENGKSQMFSVPLLAAQGGDVAKLSYTVKLPKEFSASPVFSSGYYADGIDNYMDISVEGGVITAAVKQKLMAGDALNLSLDLDAGYFSMRHVAGQTLLADRLLLIACWVLALLLWFFKMRYRLPKPGSQTRPPAGANAGVMRCILAGDTPELALMAADWAANGYLTIIRRADGTCCLHRRMVMGNERESYETKVFQALFSKGDTVEVPGRRYRSVAQYAPKPALHFWVQRLFRKNAVSPLFLRLICLAAGLAASLATADLAIPSGPVRLLAVIPLTLVGGGLFWLVQAGALRLLHRGVRRQRLCALGCAALLELGGALAGCGGVMLAALALQLVLGVLLLFGVQRSGNGVAMLEQSLSLYRYLRGLRAGDAEKLQGQASQYFYRMLPYAEALGLGRRFAAAFSGVTLEPCGWYEADRALLPGSLAFYEEFHSCMQQLQAAPPQERLPRPARKRLARKQPAPAKRRRGGAQRSARP